MVNRRTARLDLLALTFVVFLTLSKGFDTTTGRHVSRTAVYEIQRVHWKTETKNQRATADLQVYHPQRSAPVKSTLKRKSLKSKLLAKANKLGTNTTITIDLNGPNVCGNRCCTGWTAALKTKKCTKPRCFPRCQNGAICRHPNTCVCRRGFHGSRCELAAVTHAPTIEVHPRPTSTPATPVTTPARLWTNGAGAWASRIPPTSAPRPSSTAGPTSAPRPSSTAGPSSTSRPSSIASPSSTSGPTSAPRPSSTAGPTSAPRPSSTAGPSSTSRPSSIASPSSAPRPSSTAGPSSAPRPSSTAGPSFAPRPSSTLKPGPKTQQALRWLPLTLREAQSVLLKKALANRGQGEKMTSLLLKHVEAEREKLHSLLGTQTSSVKTIHTQRGQYTIHVIATPADNQTAGGGRGGGGGGGGGGGRGLRGAERIKVLFTPTVCKVRCTQDRCTNFCERGNVTTLYSSGEQGGPLVPGPGFRVFLCPLLCRNGGVCIQKDRCLCPPNFTGKFCHIPVTGSSTNDIEKPPPGPSVAANQAVLRHSEFILPLQSQSHPQASASGTSMVKVRVQHPPEATVKIHQVVKVGYGPTVREQSETVTWSAGLSGTRNTVQPGQRAEAPPPQVQAQTIRGDSVYTESSGFKYCFREVRNGQCSSPLPGLRSQETCCRGAGLAWGINECTLCPSKTANSANGERSCPSGFERNGTQCVDINECLQPGFCENGNCVNTRGSHSCVCRTGYLLDASHGICVSQKVISEDKGQCYRIVSQGTCTLPILRNITKQICCCSRVGKAWGRSCEKCPYFGSDGFKEICPAGPGYQYSASANNFHQRAQEQLGTAGASLTPQSRPQLPSSAGSHTAQSRPQLPSSAGSHTAQSRPQLPSSAGSHTAQSRPQLPSSAGSHTAQSRPQLPSSAGSHTAQSRPQLPSSTGSHTAQSRPQQPAGSAQEAAILPQQTGATRSDGQPIRPLPVPATPRPAPPRPALRACEADPRICGSGRCVNLPDGKHTCVCNPGYQLNAQQGRCQDVDECRRTPPPCDRGQCQNTDGGYRCTCPTGYRSGPLGTSCIDVNECVQTPRLCSPGQCQNTPGSFRCACPAGFQSSPQQTQCLDVDECRQAPSLCANGRCENTLGSYRCACSTGYKLQGNTCADIDECRQSPVPCANGRCENTPGSYRCACSTGYKLQGNTCTDIDECRQAPNACANGRCENTLGSYRCACSTGYKLQGNTCTDIDECRQTPNVCANGRCENTLGSYRCACSTGYKLQGSTCTDVDECRQTPNVCANGRCENTLGSYRCACSTGYKLQGNTCTDVDECENALQCPGQECFNSQGSFSCSACKPGFSLQNRKCQDVDECQRFPPPCANGRCHNSPGSYRCECLSGFRLQNNTCTDVDECEDPLQCPGQECVNSEGSYICIPCRVGYTMQNRKCSDVDECRNPRTCSRESRCVNTDGSYRCECNAGFRASGPGRQCRDINECVEGDVCSPRGACVNSEGSYHCVCSEGYQPAANGTRCVDVDECARPGVCQDGRCANTVGSFQCQCREGFAPNPERTACLDVDECAELGGTVCRGQRCENSIGSYHCITTCEPGYQLTGSGVCVDINECANKTVCGEHAFCQNLIGTYHCMCDQGYEATSDDRGCVDENECVTMQGVCGAARCENVEGSFLCECPGEDEEFDLRTARCRGRPRPGHPMFPGSSSSSSSSSSISEPESQPRPDSSVRLPPPRPGEARECYHSTREQGSCNTISRNTTHQECCCTIGEAWGLDCQFSPCPTPGSAEYQELCPSGKGYVTTGPGAFSYRDVDECKVFDPQVCKSGVCVNHIPGYSCYCTTGYYYDTVLLECIDNNECERGDSCEGGLCINTVGSYFCSCEPPLVLDDTQRRCINSTSLTVDENLAFCWQHVTASLVCQSPLLEGQVTFTECCCLYGEAWGLQCALCPARDSDDYEALCSVLRTPVYTPPFTGRGYGPSRGPTPGRGYGLPYDPESYPEPLPPGPDYFRPGYDDYPPPGGRRPGYGGIPVDPYGVREPPYSQPGAGRYYEEDFDPRFVPSESDLRPPFRIVDPLTEPAYGARPRPPSRGDPRSLSLAPLPENYEEDEDEDEQGPSEPWRSFLPREAPPYPDFSEGRLSDGLRRDTYERRYESYEGLGAEDCGILHGCENGRCIRVAEGYTCDCYDGYHLDMTSMTCIDINECEEADDLAAECVNGQCVNTDGSYRCLCLRGFIMSRRPNHCIRSRP
ncbi:latent-transforming growth factor beta-binding protein 4 isoform X25 [Anguilla rostrata]|uniref:latent-transforming growth factor beta-binding protein 4 isoform X25 n=1 Tax=Anguilla rostrata TaxID=7938 RepID=UPI0030D0E379